MLTQESLAEVDNRVKQHYAPIIEQTDIGIVEDGIVDLQVYNAAKYKILWILKEANEDGGDGGWSITKDLLAHIRDGNRIKSGLEKTFTKVIYTTFGILNDYVFDGMDDIKDDPAMIDIIKSIGYINIKKQPGKAIANHNELKAHYERDKQVVLYQIAQFNPDIIICGGTANYILTDLGLSKADEQYSGECNYWFNDNRLVIDIQHPNGRSSKTKYYVDGIVEAVRLTLGK